MSKIIKMLNTFFENKAPYQDMEVYGLTEAQASIVHDLTEIDR